MRTASPAASLKARMSEAPVTYAVLPDYDLMIEALDERRKELNISCNELDDLADVATGYVAKCFGASRTKRLGWKSTFKIVRQLGLRIVFEIDPDATAATLAVARQRQTNQAREGNFAVPASKRVIDRALRYMATEFSWNEILAAVGKTRATVAAEQAAKAKSAAGPPAEQKTKRPAPATVAVDAPRVSAMSEFARTKTAAVGI